MPSHALHFKGENMGEKILFVLNARFSDWKGTQRFYYEFGKLLVQHGYTVTLIEDDRKPTEETMQVPSQLPFNIITIHLRKIFSIYFVPRKALEDINPDILYVNSFNIFPILPFSKFKVIFGMHIVDISYLKYATIRFKLKFYIKKILFSAIVKLAWRDKTIMIHALNTDQRDWINRITKDRFPVRIIGNPVDFNIKKSIAYIKNMEKNEKFTVLFFGKGFYEFLRVINYLMSTSLNEEILFIIAGGGRMKQEAETLSRSSKNIRFIERPSDEEKKNIMLSSDLFVFPSVYENFPFTAVEAQSSGLPCLFSDITPLRNIVIEGKTGYCLSLDGAFEKRFFDKIQEYLLLWSNDYERYKEMRVEIAEITSRLSKENVFPKLLDMVGSFLES